MFYNFNDDITLNKTSNSYSNDTYNITNNNNLFDITDNQYFTKNIKIVQAIPLTISQYITITIMNIM